MSKGCQLDWKSSNSVVVRGEIDEHADFSSFIKLAGQILYVDLAEVIRLNSSGLRSWIQTIVKNQIQLVLRNCSPIVVEQFALIPQFIGNQGRVESFFARYQCVACNHEELKRFQFGQNINETTDQIPLEFDAPCKICGDVLELDQSDEIYRAFLQYSLKSGRAS
ncbi:MAG: hypothetical protein EOP10_03180 [Proteobacteria bacterium]|nr:MAG: hypothetical protein EOP10_03180 [Pseudomonadota bacterium]